MRAGVRPAAWVVSVSLFVGLVGAAWGDGSDVINACAKRQAGLLRVVDGGDDCLPSETAMSWNVQGPPGSQGPPGPPGPPGSGVAALTHRSVQTPISTGGAFSLSPTCEAGEHVTSGGFDTNLTGTYGGWTVSGSMPYVTGTLEGWRVRGRNDTGKTVFVTVWMVCAA